MSKSSEDNDQKYEVSAKRLCIVINCRSKPKIRYFT